MSRILHKDTLTGFRLYYRLPMAMLPDDLTVTTSCIFYYPTFYISSFEGPVHERINERTAQHKAGFKPLTSCISINFRLISKNTDDQCLTTSN